MLNGSIFINKSANPDFNEIVSFSKISGRLNLPSEIFNLVLEPVILKLVSLRRKFFADPFADSCLDLNSKFEKLKMSEFKS